MNSDQTSSEQGFTLVELIVYVVLLAVIGTLTATLIINVFRVNQDITGTSVSSNDAQVFMERVELSVRNAALYEVKSLGTNSSVLLVQTRSTTASNITQQFCRAFVFDATKGELRYAQQNPSASGPWVGITTLEQWRARTTLAVDGVGLVASQPTFVKFAGGVDTAYAVQESGAKTPVELETRTRVLKSGSAEGKCF